MVKKQTKMRRKIKEPIEHDSVFFLKLVLYVVLGATWIKFDTALSLGPILLNGVPVGLVLGLLFASHDHFQIDRKIEYALLLIMAILTFFLPAGIVL